MDFPILEETGSYNAIPVLQELIDTHVPFVGGLPDEENPAKVAERMLDQIRREVIAAGAALRYPHGFDHTADRLDLMLGRAPMSDWAT